ncbi:ABC transporter ATP-binding protein [Candidatus Fermentibacteria bacterium]|nr:ABC transporter ATP-binding protein [Candidatus Fermentibacteria bacterium]
MFRFLRPYAGRLILSLVCMMFFSLLSGATLGMISPFARALFQPEISLDASVGETHAAPPSDFAPLAAVQGMANRAKGWALRLVSGATPYETLQRVCVAALALFLIKALFWYAQAYLFATVEQGLIRDLRHALYGHIQGLSLSFFHSVRTGDLVSRITNDVTLVRTMIRGIMRDLLQKAFELAVYLIIVFWASWQLALVSLGIFPPIMFIVARIGKRLRRQSVRAQERMADISSTAQERIAGIRLVKASHTEDQEVSRFSMLTGSYYRAMVKMIRLSQLSGPLAEFLGAVGAISVLIFGGKLVLADDALSADRFLVFLAALLSTMSPVKAISKVHNEVQEGLAGADRVAQILRERPMVTERPDARDVRDIHQGIRFNDVHFHYSNGRGPALRGVSFTIPVGQVTAVVGPSGAGKSTIADLLVRFYDPTQGAVLLDDVSLPGITLSSLRAMTGIVSQETILFHDSIEANIAYGCSAAGRERIIEAARAANIHDFIASLPDGYATTVGERGVQLSGGQRQRIAIARAILRDPRLLVFDEATSSLDTESERLVQEAMSRLMAHRTCFVIAHRLSSVQNAHQIIVLNDGQIVEQGSHATLLGQRGLYWRLYQWQLSGEGAAAVDTPGTALEEEKDAPSIADRRVIRREGEPADGRIDTTP